MVLDRDFVRFLACSAGVMLAGVLLVIAFVVVVDPYRIYCLVDVPGFNHVKPQLDRYQEEIKLTVARSTKANALILGNSRAEWGLNPDYAGFSKKGLSTYNLALSGTKISIARRELEYLCDLGQRPEMVMLGVDFIDFLVDPIKPNTSLNVPKSEYRVNSLRWKFDAMFSMTSVIDAVKTLLIQQHSEAEIMTPRGFNPMLEYKKYVRDLGYHALFQQRALDNVKSLAGKPHGLVRRSSGSSLDLDELRMILSIAARDKMELQLIIYPYHAQILAMFEQLGLWPVFEQWKSMLAIEVAAIKKNYPDARVALWDFSGFSEFQCEHIPGKGDMEKATQWYWEAGHFKQALGDMVLARALAKSPELVTENSLGFPLTVSTLAQNNRRIARERAACAASYPDLFSDVSRLVKDVRSAHP